jgi:hypothetical protein
LTATFVLTTALGCAAPVPRASGFTEIAFPQMRSLHESRWLWVDAECSDGPLDLTSRGFDQQLRVERISSKELLFLFDSALAAEGCTQTLVWAVTPALENESWHFVEQARVSLPADADDLCHGSPEPPRTGRLRQAGDLLEVTVFRSDWCRGFDARFVFRRAAPANLSDAEIIRHWAAHFNRRDGGAIAALYAERGSLAEPFSSTIAGVPRRHDGRTAVRNWYVRSFAGLRWLAIRPLSIEPSGEPGHYLVDWQYMDDRLKSPLEGRNLFLIADGEIYQTELQLLSKPIVAERSPQKNGQ